MAFERPTSSSRLASIANSSSMLSMRSVSPVPSSLGVAELFPPEPAYSAVPVDTEGQVSPERSEKRPTPVPYLKILPLLISRIAEGVIYAVIFPYINEMMRGFGVPEERVGVWSVLAESALQLTEAVSAPFYAVLGDKVGRRPVIIVLIFIFGLSGMAYGFVTSVWMAILGRAALGCLVGCAVLSRTMCGELCDRTNRVKGFAIFSPALITGVTIAPLIGGFLSHPVPHLLPESAKLFAEYPYLLPALAAGSIGIIASVSCFILLPETLPTSMRGHRHGHGHAPRKSPNELFSYKPFQLVMILQCLNNSVQYGWEAMWPLFAFTSQDLGGLGLPIHQIGIVLATSAVWSIVMTSMIYPHVHARMREDNCLRLSVIAYPLGAALFPLIWALHFGHKTIGFVTWTAIIAQMLLRRLGDCAGTLLDAMVFESTPGPEFIALANSMGMSLGAVGRATGPFVISYFFSLSTHFADPNTMGRQLVWVIFILLCLPSIVLSWQTAPEEKPHADDEETVELMVGQDLERAIDGEGSIVSHRGTL